MLDLLSFLLPIGLAIAVSPVAVFGVTRMTLRAPVSLRPDWGFLVGWVVGVVALVSLTTLVLRLVTGPMTGTAYRVVAGLLMLAVGVLAWVVALRRWRARPRPGRKAQWPSWAEGVEEADPARASGLGFALATLDTKNLLLGAGAGAYLAIARPAFTTVLWSVLALAVIASSALLVVILGFRFARARVEAPLGRLAEGLELNLGGIESAVLLVAGGLAVGVGLGIF